MEGNLWKDWQSNYGNWPLAGIRQVVLQNPQGNKAAATAANRKIARSEETDGRASNKFGGGITPLYKCTWLRSS